MPNNIENAKEYFMEGVANYSINKGSRQGDRKCSYPIEIGEINGVPITIHCSSSKRAYGSHMAAAWLDETKKAMTYSVNAARLKAKLAAKKAK